MSADLFDITVAIEQFKAAAKSYEDDVIIDCYILAFKEILK